MRLLNQNSAMQRNLIFSERLCINGPSMVAISVVAECAIEASFQAIVFASKTFALRVPLRAHSILTSKAAEIIALGDFS